MCSCRTPPSGGGGRGLRVQDDAGAVLHLSALEGGVSLLQVLDHRQQPSSDALTRLPELSVAFCSIYETQSADDDDDEDDIKAQTI